MATPQSFPAEIKSKNVSVKIYRVRNKGYDEFRLVWYDTSGQRKMRSFADYTDAESEAHKVNASFATGNADTLVLPRDEATMYRRAVGALRPLAISVDAAALRYAEAVNILGSDTLIEAVRFFVAKNPRSLPKRTVSEVCSEMLEAKAKDGVTAIYLQQLSMMLRRFSESFSCQIADVNSQQVNAFLRALNATGRTRNNYRGSIGTLFRFAETCGYVSKGHLDLGQVARARQAQSAIEIFKPEELAKLIDAARLDPDNLPNGWRRDWSKRPGMLPYLVLGGFAGLRTAEIQRQLWSDINLQRGFIRVTAAKGNTAQKRLVPISGNLKQWLEVCWRTSGTCCDYAYMEGAVRRLAKRTGIEWKHNALRHSFISYRVAHTQNIPQVSLEAGNSVQMVNRHYRELVTEADAMAWFAIAPDKLRL